MTAGAFSLQNISLGAGFRVPFVVDPLELDFNFCTREQPFLLTVSLFGGGGYFLMKATPIACGRSLPIQSQTTRSTWPKRSVF